MLQASAVGSSDGMRLVIKCNGDWTSALLHAAGGAEAGNVEERPKQGAPTSVTLLCLKSFG